MGPLVGAIDEGTSSARFMLFKVRTNKVVASHQKKITPIIPKEGWLEHNPLHILEAVYECIEETIKKLEQLGGSVKDILAIGITNQRESTLVWHKETGQPFHNIIIWSDMRTTTTVDKLLDSVPNRNINHLKSLCGLPLSPYFSALKLKWLQENIPDVKKAIDENVCLFGTVDSWLIWNLTKGKEHITDVTNASRTMLMNLTTLEWDSKLLNFFQLPSNVLPTIKSSSEVYAYIAQGHLKGIPIAGCLGDQQAALVGQQCLQRGQAKATYGTGCFLLYNTGESKVESKHGLLTTVAYQLGAKTRPVYALEGSVAIAGSALNWLRDNMEIVTDLSQIEDLVMLSEDTNGDGVCFVPAFSGLYAPYWQKDARGVICGLTEETQPGHIVKATLEAVCFQIRDVIEAMNKDYGSQLKQLKVDGGMTTSSLLMQLQADLTGITIIRPEMAESTALGAAMVAGAAVGCWDLNKSFTTSTPMEWHSKLSNRARDLKFSRWKMAIERACGWEQ